MGSHPINLAVRFVLELAALGSVGMWGYSLSEGRLRFVWAVLPPLIAAAAWGTFAVPGDPSRSGAAPVPVPGLVRLGIELAVFGAGTWALFDLGHRTWGLLLAGLVTLHYIFSYDRIAWLLAR